MTLVDILHKGCKKNIYKTEPDLTEEPPKKTTTSKKYISKALLEQFI